DRLDVGLEQVPHVVDGRLIGDVQIALQRLVDDARAGAGIAVVEVDERAVERERLLDFAPIAFVGGNLERRPVRNCGCGGGGPGEAVRPQAGDGGGGYGSRTTEKIPSGPHVAPPATGSEWGLTPFNFPP